MLSEKRYVIEPSRFDAVIFDMDGIVTNTTGTHRDAWKTTFDAFLVDHFGPDVELFNVSSDYLTYVDGKPRYDGVRSFLASRGVVLPEISSDAMSTEATVRALGDRKNEIFRELLRTDGAQAYESTVVLVRDLQRCGFGTALFTSSSNAGMVLSAAGVSDLFHVVIDGVVAAERGLPGKPAPDVLLAAVEELGVQPSRAVVIEDARSGVEAGVAAGFGLILGVARDNNAQDLLAAGAHEVFPDLGDVGVGSRAVDLS